MSQRETIDTTYADLRPTDLVIDKSGQPWPIAELEFTTIGAHPAFADFWLLDPVTKVKIHKMAKPAEDAVRVSRLPTQADEASKLEAEFPGNNDDYYIDAENPAWKLEAEFPATAGRLSTSAEEQAELQEKFPKDWAPAGTVNDSYLLDSHPTMAEAVAAVEEIGGTVEAEVTAAEVDAAAAATDDAPVSLPPFADMTPLEQRSHLYLLHGLYGSDVTGKAELIAIHEQAHTQHDAGTLNSRHVPHVHEVK